MSFIEKNSIFGTNRDPCIVLPFHSPTLGQSVSHCLIVSFCQSSNIYCLLAATLATPEERPASPERKSQLVRVTQIIVLSLYGQCVFGEFLEGF